VESAAAHQDPRLWRVVGVLQETKTPIDELVLINLDSFFRISEHRGGVVPESGRPAISAVVLFPKPGVHKALLLGELSKRTRLQVADVDAEVHQLLRIVGNVDRILLFVAALVVIASVLSVAVAIYNSLTARRREFGILRVLGAGRRIIFGLIVAESTLLSAVGAAVGLGLGHLAVWLSAGSIERIAGFRPRSASLLPEEIAAFALIVVAGAVGGLIPALRAYRSDAASQLSPAV
jgi:putative ABC transport system permease protein